MAKTDFEVPVIGEYLETPALQPGAMAKSAPFKAAPQHQQALGFPGELVENWEEVAIAKLGELGELRVPRGGDDRVDHAECGKHAPDRLGLVEVYVYRALARHADDLVPARQRSDYFRANGSCCTNDNDFHGVVASTTLAGKHKRSRPGRVTRASPVFDPGCCCQRFRSFLFRSYSAPSISPLA